MGSKTSIIWSLSFGLYHLASSKHKLKTDSRLCWNVMFQNTWKIAHLDIKPLNFLIRETSDTSYDVVLTDFGISQCYQTCLLESNSATTPEITSLEDLINAVSSNELTLVSGKVFKIRRMIWLIWVGWLANKKTL